MSGQRASRIKGVQEVGDAMEAMKKTQSIRNIAVVGYPQSLVSQVGRALWAGPHVLMDQKSLLARAGTAVGGAMSFGALDSSSDSGTEREGQETEKVSKRASVVDIRGLNPASKAPSVSRAKTVDICEARPALNSPHESECSPEVSKGEAEDSRVIVLRPMLRSALCRLNVEGHYSRYLFNLVECPDNAEVAANSLAGMRMCDSVVLCLNLESREAVDQQKLTPLIRQVVQLVALERLPLALVLAGGERFVDRPGIELLTSIVHITTVVQEGMEPAQDEVSPGLLCTTVISTIEDWAFEVPDPQNRLILSEFCEQIATCWAAHDTELWEALPLQPHKEDDDPNFELDENDMLLPLKQRRLLQFRRWAGSVGSALATMAVIKLPSPPDSQKLRADALFPDARFDSGAALGVRLCDPEAPLVLLCSAVLDVPAVTGNTVTAVVGRVFSGTVKRSLTEVETKAIDRRSSVATEAQKKKSRLSFASALSQKKVAPNPCRISITGNAVSAIFKEKLLPGGLRVTALQGLTQNSRLLTLPSVPSGNFVVLKAAEFPDIIASGGLNELEQEYVEVSWSPYTSHFSLPCPRPLLPCVALICEEFEANPPPPAQLEKWKVARQAPRPLVMNSLLMDLYRHHIQLLLRTTDPGDFPILCGALRQLCIRDLQSEMEVDLDLGLCVLKSSGPRHCVAALWELVSSILPAAKEAFWSVQRKQEAADIDEIAISKATGLEEQEQQDLHDILVLTPDGVTRSASFQSTCKVPPIEIEGVEALLAETVSSEDEVVCHGLALSALSRETLDNMDSVSRGRYKEYSSSRYDSKTVHTCNSSANAICGDYSIGRTQCLLAGQLVGPVAGFPLVGCSVKLEGSIEPETLVSDSLLCNKCGTNSFKVVARNVQCGNHTMQVGPEVADKALTYVRAFWDYFMDGTVFTQRLPVALPSSDDLPPLPPGGWVSVWGSKAFSDLPLPHLSHSQDVPEAIRRHLCCEARNRLAI